MAVSLLEAQLKLKLSYIRVHGASNYAYSLIIQSATLVLCLAPANPFQLQQHCRSTQHWNFTSALQLLPWNCALALSCASSCCCSPFPMGLPSASSGRVRPIFTTVLEYFNQQPSLSSQLTLCFSASLRDSLLCSLYYFSKSTTIPPFRQHTEPLSCVILLIFIVLKQYTKGHGLKWYFCTCVTVVKRKYLSILL